MKLIEKLADDWADKHITHGEMTSAIVAYQEGFRKARELGVEAIMGVIMTPMVECFGENIHNAEFILAHRKTLDRDAIRDLGESEVE